MFTSVEGHHLLLRDTPESLVCTVLFVTVEVCMLASDAILDGIIAEIVRDSYFDQYPTPSPRNN
jgi:hypothetical protein